ncbi:hypothetical protein PHELEMICH_58 [Mycobacterium phage Phelemich]|uniref:Uncharacterized protein n=2 Tax=Acadianvirus reprobate TaxID=1982903 RepID=S5Y7R8_9CAUD|nr:hypothetical protein N847_gp58 [Mycobacterium phage Phelemich]YP_008409980.1 hypothetical protein REPROBATE_59 [Mycobacterium phage Reprobate]AGT12795.1 hypothetical protein REPROBATE_59 [Mycobacterium phage Reprobate]AGT13972.1 hypothetical protein PHELEMICH_58 [Mycobacterium phage Phelemich]
MPADPITGTRDVDWLRSVTDTRVTRRALQGEETMVVHTAYFGIRPETVPDVLTPYTRSDEHFRPEFMTVKWVDGKLNVVALSGPLRRRNGGVSEKVTRKRNFESYWSREAPHKFDRDRLPAGVPEAIAAYETAVAVATSGAAR